MNILAIVIPHSNRFTGDFLKLYFPLGLSYIIGTVRHYLPEANITIADFFSEEVFSEDNIRFKLNLLKKNIKPDYILFGGMITSFFYIRNLSKILRDFFPQAKLILGGSAAGSGHRLFIKDDIIDYYVCGEGEESIVDILTGNAKRNPGVITKNDKHLPVRQLIKNLDSLPFPSYRDFNVHKYIDNNYRDNGWKSMPIIASRGCPFSCNFCYPNFGKILRLRNEELVIEELNYLKINYNLDSIEFWDENQFLNKGWVEKFCQRLINRKLNLKWNCAAHASSFTQKDIALLKLAKKAGCLRISIGIESGDQSILDRMNKKTTIEQIENALRLIREAGIKATGTLMAGYPGENLTTLDHTIKFGKRNLLKPSFSFLIPLPGSKIYDDCISQGIITNEIDYLEKVSYTGGDASKIFINLTEMDTDTYQKEVKHANRFLNKIRINDVIKYYGFIKGITTYLKYILIKIKLKINRQQFETP